MNSQRHESKRVSPLSGGKLPSIDDVFDERISLGRYVRSRPYRTAVFLGGAVTAVAAVTALVVAANREQSIARAELRKNLGSATGAIAYASGTRIAVVTPQEILEEKTPRAYQLGGAPYKLAWLSDHEIVFSRPHPNGSLCTLQGKERSYSSSAASTLVEVLNIETATIQTLVDPYNPTPEFTKLFGDCKAADDKLAATTAAEKLRLFDSPGSGWKIWVDADVQGKFIVEGLGSTPNSTLPSIKVNDVWYAIAKLGDGYSLQSSVIVPTNSDQFRSPCGRFVLEEPSKVGQALDLDCLEIRATSGNRGVSVPLSKNARYGAWRL